MTQHKEEGQRLVDSATDGGWNYDYEPRQGCRCDCCGHGEGVDCACDCHETGKCSAPPSIQEGQPKDMTTLRAERDAAESAESYLLDALREIATMDPHYAMAEDIIERANRRLHTPRAKAADAREAQQREELERLREWRCTVTAALRRQGGAFYEDVPKHIREMWQELERVKAELDGARLDLRHIADENVKWRKRAMAGEQEIARLREALREAREFVCSSRDGSLSCSHRWVLAEIDAALSATPEAEG
jgi:hypothetical protein